MFSKPGTSCCSNEEMPKRKHFSYNPEKLEIISHLEKGENKNFTIMRDFNTDSMAIMI